MECSRELVEAAALSDTSTSFVKGHMEEQWFAATDNGDGSSKAVPERDWKISTL